MIKAARKSKCSAKRSAKFNLNFTYARKIGPHTHVQIARQWESTLRLILSTTLPSHSIATLRSRLSYAWIRKDNKRHGSRCKQNERSRQLGRGLGATNTRP